MEAKIFKDKKQPSFDLMAIKIDEYSLAHLKQGHPLRVAVFTDDREDLPWYKRSCLIINIGSNIDLTQEERLWKDKLAHDGIVDKSYLLTSIREVRDKFVAMFQKELEVLGIMKLADPDEKIAKTALPSHFNPQEFTVDDLMSSANKINDRQINLQESAQALSLSTLSLSKLAKSGKVKGQHGVYFSGWSFLESDIKKILEEEPEFLKKIWNHNASLKNHPQDPADKEITFNNRIYLRAMAWPSILKLSLSTIQKYINQGLLTNLVIYKNKKYLPKDYLEELSRNPPSWLKKSWRYFNNSKENQE